MKTGSILVALNFEEGNLPSNIQLIPAGSTIIGQDGRQWNVPDAQRLVDATNAQRRALPIDENHAIDLKGSKGDPSPAVGWIEKVYLNDSGQIWAAVSWNGHGKWLVESLSYRFISPVFRFDKTTGEILAIIGAGLTNRPNLELTALNNQTEEDSMKVSSTILTALGLSADADENQTLAAINALKNGQDGQSVPAVDLAAYAPRADYTLMEQRALNAEKALQDMKDASLQSRAEEAVNAAIKARKIAPASKDAYLALCSSEEGLNRFEEIVKTSPEILSKDTAAPDGNPPEADAKALNAEEAQIARMLGLPVEQKSHGNGSGD